MNKVVLYLCLFVMIGCSILIGYGLKKCDCDVKNIVAEKSEEELLQEKYTFLNNKLLEYLNDIYNNDKWMNGGLEFNVYRVTLRDLSSMGYDISMFIHPISKFECNLDNTYGEFIVLGITDDGMTDYTYRTNVSCPIDFIKE